MYKKALSALTAATALAALTLAPATPASAASIQVIRGYVATVREPGSDFHCPENEVMIGRKHSGDENGYTTYFCGQIYVNGQRAEVSEPPYKVRVEESHSHYYTPDGHAVVGRMHYGDENGTTWYYSAPISWQGKPVRLVNRRWTGDMKESDHGSIAGPNEVMTGRDHYGDENGRTRYQYATVVVDG